MKEILTWSLVLVLGLGLIVGCGKLPDERLLEKGKKLEEKMAFSEAVVRYEKLVDDYPQSPFGPEALYRAGLIYANGLRKFPKAVSTLERVIETYPESPFAAQAQFMIGFIYANSAPDTAKARLAYRAFVEKYPDHELVPSVRWELKYLGKAIEEIPELSGLERASKKENVAQK